MRKLVFVSNQYYPNVVGGAELTVQTLAEELAGRGIPVAVISLSLAGDSVDEVSGIRVHRLAIANVYAPFQQKPRAHLRALWHLRDAHNQRMADKVARVLLEEGADCVSTQNLGGFSVAVWAAARRLGIKVVHTLHDYYLLCPRTTMYRNEQRCARACSSCKLFSLPKQLASRNVDVAIGVSDFVLQRHMKSGYFRNARTAVVYNGKDWLPPAPRPARVAGQPLRIGFIGRVEATKGIEVLLEAVSRLPAAQFRLQVAGRASEPEYLARLQRDYPLPNVEYLGYVKADAFYQGTDVVVVPSLWHEPLPAVVYEPLGHGVPVLASRVGGIPEILAEQGQHWLFSAGDAGDLSAKLGQLGDDPGRLEAQRSWALARRADFSQRLQADQFLKAIEV
jgi:glycosyltransferase involved in cell wall biosynthesis